MAEKRTSDADVTRVSASFGQRAIKLAEDSGRSRQDLMRDADISVSTLNRLARGDGSMFTARAVKKVLRSWGLDVSTLPSIDPDEDEREVGSMDEELREGLALIRRLRQLASAEKYGVELNKLRALVHACELVNEGTGGYIAEGTGEHSRRKP